ncbi:MAG TPA: DNA repair protein RecN [Solirubrobacterales bacterium]
MLLELRIENLLLIDRAEIRFGEGLNAITGETGAGKTVLAHSLDLLMGGRARPQIVRPGADEAYVEGVFSVPEGLFDDPELRELAERLPEGSDEIVLGRRVGASGRTSAFVGGRSAPASDLRALGARLIAFYGQHEHRKLTLAAAQAAVLDGFGGPDQIALRDAYHAAHAEVGAITRELEAIRERDGARERDLDLLRYELGEIDAAAPDPDEEAELAAERERLRHSEGLREGAERALGAIAGDGEDSEGSVTTLLAAGEGALAPAGGVDDRLDALAERVGALAIEASDLGGELRSYLEGLEADPERLQQVEERLDTLDRLRRKHGGTIESVLEHAERCRAEVERLEGAEVRSAELDERLAEAIASRARLGRKLSEERVRLVPELQERIAAELSALAMEGAALDVVLEPVAPAVDGGEGYAASGRETVELQLATNPGMPAGPLRDAASGGELSRVMLALSGLVEADGVATLVFDEIDAGVGGNTARAVGERLRRIGESRQVIAITHLPQVASLASRHFRIEKSATGGPARADVECVEGEELVAEICRMLGADREDEAASRHARELLAA